MLNFLNTPSKNLLPFDGEVYYKPSIFSCEESSVVLKQLLRLKQWKQEPIKIFGKIVMQPRLTAWFADDGKRYSYSGITMLPEPWNDTLLDIKQRVYQTTGLTFNSALLNLYRNGADSMGWHRDNERELGANPTIASVSFGAVRNFKLRHYNQKLLVKKFQLESGSCLLMQGATQYCWEHCLPKTNAPIGTRVNITFRNIMD